MKQDLLKGVNNNKVSIVSGDTGSGKSTQLIQYLYEDYLRNECQYEFKAIITQPRRIAAINLAKRVQLEMENNLELQRMDEDIKDRVGYIVGLDRKMNDKTKILFVTTGIFLQILANNGIIDKVSHVILDEVHERDIDSDFAMIALKHLLGGYTKNKHNYWNQYFRLILMSATINA